MQFDYVINFFKNSMFLLILERSKSDSLMPFIQINTSSKSVVENEDLLQRHISKLVSDLTGKPENYVMTMIQSDNSMTFAGSDEPCCFMKIKSIGSLNPSMMSRPLCELIASKTNININRVYIEFIDVKASNWGFNGSTFG